MKTLLLLPLLLLAVFSCQEESFFEEVSTQEADAAQLPAEASSVQRQQRPFSGQFETISLPLSAPPLLQQKITGSGHASHLGKSTFEAFSTVNFAQQPPFHLAGTATMVAANGDMIYSTFTGTSVPRQDGKLLVTVHHIISGGTGRFEHASGHYTGIAVADRTIPEGSIRLEGVIAY